MPLVDLPAQPVLELAHGAPFPAVMTWLADCWHRLQAVRMLQRLDDSQLRDLGIGRGQIDTAADELVAARRDRRR